MPGKYLNEWYMNYGPKLLEGNVRSFLTVRGKVNKNIQNKIKNYPQMFFAYNNGIAATATEIDVNKTENGLEIIRIKDLQIVNGGQTTASITNSILTAKKDENVDIQHQKKLSLKFHNIQIRRIKLMSPTFFRTIHFTFAWKIFLEKWRLLMFTENSINISGFMKGREGNMIKRRWV